MSSKTFAFLAAGTIAALIAAGCAKGTDQSSTSSTTTTTTATTAPAADTTTAAPSSMTAAAGAGDAAHGKTIFGANCATCHGANGEGGGIGPSLKNEKSRKNYDATVAQIKNPQPPMPKLYPGTLNDKDVADVATYVQSL